MMAIKNHTYHALTAQQAELSAKHKASDKSGDGYGELADEVAAKIAEIGSVAAKGPYKGKQHENSWEWYQKHFEDMREVNKARAVAYGTKANELAEILLAYEQSKLSQEGAQ